MNSRELREKRATLIMQAREILDRADTEKRDLTQEERNQYDRIDQEIDRLAEEIARVEKREARERELALRDAAAMRGQTERTSDPKPEIRAFEAYLRAGAVPAEVRAALNEATAAQGGYLVPVEYSRQLVQGLQEQSMLRQAGAQVIRMTGLTMKVPTLSNTSAAVLTAEGAAFDEAEPTVGQIDVTAYKYTRLAKVSDELLADAMFDVWANILLPDFTQAFAKAENSAFTTGTGSSQPQGVVTGAGVGKTAASATAITSDEVIDLFHSLDYRHRQNAAWMMNDATAQVLRKLKDTTGQYLWQPGLVAGQPDRILGRPVMTNNMMATPAASAKTILFGNFSYYWIFDREDLTIARLNELYAASGQVGFRAFKRMDAHVMLSTAFKVLQQASA